tara:strand:- start:1152 stop:1622 length:471 start_codon:yes stop_codon:yes gene_type:complete
MNVIQIDGNGDAYGYPVLANNFRMLFPTVSFPNPLTPEAVEGYGYGCYEFASAPECDSTHKAVEIAPQKGEDGVYRQSYEIVSLTESELAARTESQWAYVRADRNRNLMLCDWTQLADAPLTDEKRLEWVVYRQALRDITTQSDPFNITWPTKPAA